MKNARARGMVMGAVAAAALLVVLNAAFIVTQTDQALVLQFGKPMRVVQDPGLHFKTPFLENVEYFDRRLLDFNDAYSPIEVIAADQKRLIVDSFVRYRIIDPLKFKQAVGDERNLKSRLNAILEASLRQVIGSVPLADVISEKRAALMQQLRDMVNAQTAGSKLDEKGKIVEGAARGFGIEVVDVRIMRADLPKENAEGIYRRMQTEREREAKQYRAQGAEDAQKIRSTAEKERTILLAEAKKQSEILRGSGDSEAIKIFAEATGQDAEFYGFYRSLLAYRKAFSAADTTLVLAPGNDFMKYFEKGAP
ncbi:MAG: protease modulator HflC [Alphaproteobacteria bacterium]|nr:protease modulator HflC [Alphaproteobacteria bacterium]